jgi:hypothetical protein
MAAHHDNASCHPELVEGRDCFVTAFLAMTAQNCESEEGKAARIKDKGLKERE